jgi:hypothetical protein
MDVFGSSWIELPPDVKHKIPEEEMFFSPPGSFRYWSCLMKLAFVCAKWFVVVRIL